MSVGSAWWRVRKKVLAPGRTVCGLRWLPVAGQTGAILIRALAFQFPILTSFVLVGASAVLNLGLLWRYPVSAQWSERSAPRSWLATLSGLRASLSHWRRRQPVCHPVSRCVPIARPGAPLRDGVGSLESAIAMVRPREPPADLCCRTVERTRRQRGFCDPLSLPGSGRGVRPSARLRRSNCHSPAHSTCRNAKRRVQ